MYVAPARNNWNESLHEGTHLMFLPCLIVQLDNEAWQYRH